MALFTDPPELVCGTPEIPFNNYAVLGGVQSSKQIFNYNGNVYTGNLSQRDIHSSTNVSPLIAKRGTPWTLPDLTTWQLMIDDWGWFYNSSCQCRFGSLLFGIGATPDPGYLIYEPFDMATETYTYLNGLGSGTMNPYWLAGNKSSFPAIGPRCAALSDGRVIVVWTDLTSNTAGPAPTHGYNSHFTFITADVWATASAFVTVSSASSNGIKILSLCVDASDVTHVFWLEDVVRKVWHTPISSAGSVGTSDLVEDFSATPFEYTFGPGTMFNGKVTFTGLQATDANVYLFESDPVTIAWTKKTVAARTNDTGGGVYPVPVNVSASALWVHWWEQDGTIYPLSGAKSWYSVYDGSSFTAKDVGWDAGNNQYSGTGGITPPGDIDMSVLTAEFDGSNMQIMGWSEFTSGFDETELYLQIPIISGQSGYRNRAKLSLG